MTDCRCGLLGGQTQQGQGRPAGAQWAQWRSSRAGPAGRPLCQEAMSTPPSVPCTPGPLWPGLGSWGFLCPECPPCLLSSLTHRCPASLRDPALRELPLPRPSSSWVWHLSCCPQVPTEPGLGPSATPLDSELLSFPPTPSARAWKPGRHLSIHHDSTLCTCHVSYVHWTGTGGNDVSRVQAKARKKQVRKQMRVPKSYT